MWLTMTSRLLGSAPALLFPSVTPFISEKNSSACIMLSAKPQFSMELLCKNCKRVFCDHTLITKLVVTLPRFILRTRQEKSFVW